MEARGIEPLLDQAAWMEDLARRLVDGAAADDAAQEVWLAALAGRERVANPRAWLARVLRRAADHLQRGERRRRAHERSAARPERLASTLDAVERASTRRAVAEAVLALARPERELVLQRFYLGLTLRAIAAREGVSVAAVDERVARALARLRPVLARRLGLRGERLVLALVPFLGRRRAPRTAFAPAAALGTAAAVAALLAASLWRGTDRPAATRAHAALPGSTVARAEEAERMATGGVPASGRQPDARPEARDEVPLAPAALLVRLSRAPDAPAEPVTVVLDAGFIPEGGPRVAVARGSARFEGLPPGPWMLTTDRGGALAVTLSAGGEHVVELTVPEGPPLAGVVLDPRGEPVPYAEVWLAPTLGEGDGVTRPVVEDVASVVADTNGAFRIASTGAARTIGARARGLVPVELAFGGEDVELRAEARGGALAGIVRDARGVACPGARVVLDAGGSGAHLVRTRTDATGGFRFDSAAPGIRHLVCAAAGSALASERVLVEAGEETVLEIRTSRGFALAGRVTDEHGEPLAGASVLAGVRPWSALPDERFGVLTRSDALGRYRLAGIPARAAWVVADGGAGRRAEVLVRGRDGAELLRDFTLPRGQALAGRVVDEAGNGIPGCGVVVVPPDEWPPQRATTAADGGFAVAVDSTLPHRIWFEEHGLRLAREVSASPAQSELVVRLADAERPTPPGSPSGEGSGDKR